MDFSFSLSRSIRLTFVAATAWIFVFLISITVIAANDYPGVISLAPDHEQSTDLVSADGQPLSQTDLTQLAQTLRAPTSFQVLTQKKTP